MLLFSILRVGPFDRVYAWGGHGRGWGGVGWKNDF